jgi:hypothetical protein
LGGGMVFGMMMSTLGMLPMIEMLIGQANEFVGFLVHKVISSKIGPIFGFVLHLGNFRLTWGFAISGLVNGIAW